MCRVAASEEDGADQTAAHGAHNADEGVKSLQKLWDFANPTHPMMLKYSFTTSWGVESLSHQIKSADNVASLQFWVDKTVITKCLANKMAMSELQLSHLNLAFNHGGREGLIGLLTEKVEVPRGTTGSKGNWPVRVTKDKKFLDSIVQHFEGSG